MKYVLYMEIIRKMFPSVDLLDDNVSEGAGEASSRAPQCLQCLQSQYWCPTETTWSHRFKNWSTRTCLFGHTRCCLTVQQLRFRLVTCDLIQLVFLRPPVDTLCTVQHNT